MNCNIDELANELEHLADDSEPSLRIVEQGLVHLFSLVASDPMTPSTVLDAMSKQDNEQLLCSVALNPNTDLRTLQELINSRYASVRACAAKHSSAAHYMWKLVNDDSPLVRYKLASNENLPAHIFKVMLSDPDWRVMGRARRTLLFLTKRDILLKNKVQSIVHLRSAS